MLHHSLQERTIVRGVPERQPVILDGHRSTVGLPLERQPTILNNIIVYNLLDPIEDPTL